MKQILHIFAKDVRHLWGEILLSLAITACFAWVNAKTWWQGANFQFFRSQMQSADSLLHVLVPLSWWLLIARAVHAEALVGDRQFWITRPYERGKLLAAKALFVLCFVYVPIFIAQCSLLAQAGFHPFEYLKGLLYILLLLTIILILPVFAVAAVTSNLVRMTLTLLGIMLSLIIIIAAEAAYQYKAGDSPSSFSVNDPLALPAVLLIFAVIIVLQYATRRTVLSRWLLVAIPAVLCLIGAIYSSAALIHRAYPNIGAAASAPIAVSTTADAHILDGDRDAKRIDIVLPLNVSGVAADEVWVQDGLKIEIENGNGQKWALPWQSSFGRYYATGQHAFLTLNISRHLYDEVKSAPVMLHLDLALTQARRASSWQTTLTGRDFAVPDFGACSADTLGFETIICRFPLHEPLLTYVETWLTEGPCGSSDGDSGSRVSPASGWFGKAEDQPADFGISSVEERGIQLMGSGFPFAVGPENPEERQTRKLCPGTSITFTQFAAVRHVEAELTIQNFRFPSSAGQ
jgi:hypothetical protein